MAASLGLLAGCSQVEQDFTNVNGLSDGDLVEKVIFEVLPIKDGDAPETRASAVPNGGSVGFVWEATDTVGIYPDKGSQVYFNIEDGVGTSSVSFTGGGWALKQNSTYASYYPFVGDIYLKRGKIPVSFAGQKQIGTTSPFVGARYYLATGASASENGVLRFSYSTLNTIINVNATLPGGTYTKMSLTIEEPLFVEEGTYSLDERTIVGTKFSNTLEIELEDVTLTDEATIPIYIMSAPVDLREKEVVVCFAAADGSSYKCIKTPTKEYMAGTRYGLTCDEIERDGQPVPEAVDLGLSVKWATFNVGATKPEDFGKYYAFGETKGYGEDDFSNLTNYAWNNYSSFTKTAFYTSTYKWNYGESIFAITKYSDTPEYGYKGFIDNKTVLEPQDDAASVNWGINWRTPTKAEWEELADDANCTWTLETVNGIVGFRVNSKKAGFTGSSIFLPFAGTYSQETYYENLGSYMTSNIKELPQNEYVACQQHTFKMYSENQGSGGTHFVNITFRECGYSVRPVYYEPEDGVLGVELNQSVLRLNVNESADLSATVFPENALNKSLTWSSSDVSVATVSASGRVTALKMGVATITVTSVDKNKTAACIVNVVEETGAVDLGLSVRWAPFNIGASTPEEYGDYFAWGETEPYYQSGYAQSENPVWQSGKETGYSMSSYIWGDGSSSYTRYSNSDGKTEFSDYDLVDDAARANWGGSWRTPSHEEWRELIEKCDWIWTSQEGINGYLVTSKRNGNSIFLPAAGSRGGTRLYRINSEGCYMQSSVNNNTGFWSTKISVYDMMTRTTGFSIRPVTE